MTDTKENTVIETDELNYLIKLLDDEDENIYRSIRDRFLSYGNNSSDFLKNYLNDENILLKKRAKEIVSTINFESIEEKFKKLSLKKDGDLLEDAIFLLASFGYPEVNMNKYIRKLDKMALEIESGLLKINPEMHKINSLEIINKINNNLFFENGLKGNSENYYEPDNSYINRVLDTKLGIPVTLCALYILIAKKLNLPVTGINLPGHFILKFSRGLDEFFIDPFNKGVIISIKEAKEFVKKIGMAKEDFENIPYLKDSTDEEIILRIMRNLIEIYKKNGDDIKSEQIEKLMQCLV